MGLKLFDINCGKWQQNMTAFQNTAFSDMVHKKDFKILKYKKDFILVPFCSLFP